MSKQHRSTLRLALAGASTLACIAGTGTQAIAAAAPAPAVVRSAVVPKAIPITPGAPAEFDTFGSNHQIKLRFLPAQAGSSPITGYELTLDGGTTWSTLDMPLPIEDDQVVTPDVGLLANGTVYRVAVRATSAAGPGASTPVRDTLVLFHGTARLQGADRVATAVAVSQDTFAAPGSADSAVITTTLTYADALAGANLAAQTHGPLLMTAPGRLDATVAAEVGRAVRPGATVYVLGDTGALSTAVETALRAGHRVVRLAGADRFETAIAVANQLRSLGSTGPVHLASGLNFPDGLAVTPLAAKDRGVVLLTYGTTLESSTKAWLDRNAPGGKGTTAVGDPAVAALTGAYPRLTGADFTTLTGQDRYGTAAQVARGLGTPTAAGASVGLATGTNWPDALAGAAAMGVHGGPLLLADRGDSLDVFTATYLLTAANDFPYAHKVLSAYVFGGEDVVPQSQAAQLDGFLPSTGP